MKWTDNKIGDEGAKKISEMLKTKTTLKALYLNGNNNTKER